VVLTPTYTGCPATHVIETMVREALDAAGYRHVRIESTLSPPWTTDWITAAAAKSCAPTVSPRQFRRARAPSTAPNAIPPTP
jgi:metal-sulfur cluster biosynthetic enzyme